MTRAALLRSPAFATRPEEDDARALSDIIYRRSFGRGHITLSSGQKSDFYFDMKPSMLDPRGCHLMAKMLLAEVVQAGGLFVGGLEMGAVPITGAICELSYREGKPVSGFFVRKKAKEHGAKNLSKVSPPTRRRTARGL